MFKKLKQIYLDELFHPSFLSLFINPLYFLRKGLLRGISSYSQHMKGVMLDFGCGSKPYKKLFNVSEYIGLDIQESGHTHKSEQIDVYYDGEKIPFDDNYFNSIFSSEVFEHVFNIEDILIELNRVLKPDGMLLATVPFVWDEHEIPFDFGRYTSFGIKHLLEKHGFKLIKSEKTTNYVETVFQMWNAYIYQYVLPVNPLIKLLLTIIFIFPTNVLGIILSKILPDNRNFYNNNIILAQKNEGIE